MRPLLEKKNKKGNMLLVLGLFIGLFIILGVGFVMVIGSATLNWVFDESVPLLDDLGVLYGDENNPTASANFSEYSDYTIEPLNDFVQSLTWITGIVYVMMLIAVFGLAFANRGSPNRYLIGLFFVLVIALIMGSILMSNIYENFYNDTGELGDRLKEHVLLSFMIIESPVILTVISFLAGIIIFSGIREEELI